MPSGGLGSGLLLPPLRVIEGLEDVSTYPALFAELARRGYSREDLEKIAAEGEKADVQAMHGWRRELFGDVALKLISGGVGLRFVDKRVEAVEF